MTKALRKDLSALTWGWLKVNYPKNFEAERVIYVERDEDFVIDKPGHFHFIVKNSSSVNITQTFECNGEYETFISAELLDEDCSFCVKTAYIAHKGAVLSENYLVRLYAPRGTCNLCTSGSLFDGAKKVYRGTIDFVKGCAHSKGSESEDILTLGGEVDNKSLPVLLCDEEDVEGVHAMSSGRLSAELLFYMESRGLSENEALDFVAQERLQSLLRRAKGTRL